jgi:hypothetical protein
MPYCSPITAFLERELNLLQYFYDKYGILRCNGYIPKALQEAIYLLVAL